MEYLRIVLDLGVALFAISICGLLVWRQLDYRADKVEMKRLVNLQPTDPIVFSRDLVAGLPEPARRYFCFAISEGTPLLSVANIEMKGQFGLGTKNSPKYVDICAEQVLAAPHGFVWKMAGRSGLMRISGSDAAGWTRFWIAGFIPVARLGGSPDHMRASFGRYVAEAVFWTPAALLQGEGVVWQEVDENTARVTIRHRGLEQSIDISVGDDGRPNWVAFPRWSDANPEKSYRIQPFGGHLSKFRDFAGFRLPSHIEAGNHFGTDDYFPFYVVDVADIKFPSALQ
ncbi:DUF6544 family protein [Litoreibacter halocynthiae]|uniref:DUF6544 family protein n=1 Tax=Litoreibacter halocynthiae TaxID=1242689 RepID=UPI002493AFA2|nr:DUF6544 family protein [Litoreibacter halocynthiae]